MSSAAAFAMQTISLDTLDCIVGGAETFDTCMRRVDNDLNSGDPVRHARGMQRNCFQEHFPNLAKLPRNQVIDMLRSSIQQERERGAGPGG